MSSLSHETSLNKIITIITIIIIFTHVFSDYKRIKLKINSRSHSGDFRTMCELNTLLVLTLKIQQLVILPARNGLRIPMNSN